MNKNAIQKFAIWARNELIAQVSQRAYQYGIDESGFGDASADTLNGRLLTAEEKSQRQELIKQIKEKGYKQVMEEVAYTWFNRFIALRFMEVNNYLPSHIRVFSDSTGAFKPEILNDVLHLDLPGLNSGKVAEYIESNDTDNLYRYLLLTQCNALNEALPVMFERMGGYTEMLLPNNILKQDGVLGRMVSDIPEEDWQDAVQIIGWLYQYYNSELKDDTFAQLKKNVKITKERIPAATQLFTPDWIVRYMVENSLGRLWMEGHPNAELRGGWKYYLDEAQQEPEVEAQLAKIREEYKTIRPENIKVIDPCMGSGHILVYAFDVLMQIYTAAGWDQREAAQSILKNNLYGLDIDDRAAQLAYFAVMMKARQYDRRLFSRGIQPNVYAIRESGGIQAMTIEYFHKNDPKLKADIARIVTEMQDAKEYGSILNITPVDFAGLYARFDEIREDINMMQQSALGELLPLVKCAELLARRYDVVVTNPPYAGVKGLNEKLRRYIERQYQNEKSDLYAVFITRSLNLSKCICSIVTPITWMYNPTFKDFRKTMINSIDIISLLELGADAFEAGFGTASYTYYVRQNFIKGKYYDLSNIIEKSNFLSLPYQLHGMMDFDDTDYKINHKVPNTLRSIIRTADTLDHVGSACIGLQTNDNNRFIRDWYEVSAQKLSLRHRKDTEYQSSEKWFPIVKYTSNKKWYGNLISVVNWENDGADIKNLILSKGDSISRYVRSESKYFQEGLTWSHSTYGTSFSVRILPECTIINIEGPGVFDLHEKIHYVLALMNTKVAAFIFETTTGSIHVQSSDINNFPYYYNYNLSEIVNEFAKKAVFISKFDWDSFETSWDFKRNPLV